ncbi:hypothetical protein NA56DRAFT_698127 [Hyaloscypha hepaticicola]|uniref:Uncharacterized protein n=1 Tax=Hyaloscypha hepaticicola TaxID=2082293 RepID=A0A2J6QKY0_9HELO|nr:hypothetical protein NA56DRAFT_698127 [Hyaloscypha hepaticicola]
MADQRLISRPQSVSQLKVLINQSISHQPVHSVFQTSLENQKSYSLASMDASFWTDPDNTPEEKPEYQEYKSAKHDLTVLSLEMRKARKEHAESLGFKGFF